jgi:hypothetical protein
MSFKVPVQKDNPVPQGVHVGICYSVIDLGTHWVESKQYTSGEKHFALITWELPNCRINIDGKDLPRAISRKYNLTWGKKGDLRKDLESWRGATFTVKDLSEFEFENILGLSCQLQVIHAHSEDGERTFANISGIMGIPEGMEVPDKPENPMVCWEIKDADPENPELPPVPEWVQKIITESKEWKELTCQ